MNQTCTLVTGGSDGIGAALVRELAVQGHRVAFTYRNGADRAAALVAELDGHEVQAFSANFDDPDAPAALYAEVAQLAAFLVSDKASFLTAEVIGMHGGWQ